MKCYSPKMTLKQDQCFSLCNAEDLWTDILIAELLNKFQKPLPSRGSICKRHEFLLLKIVSRLCVAFPRILATSGIDVSRNTFGTAGRRFVGATRWCLDLSTSFRAITSFNIHSIFFHLSSRRNCLYIVMSLNHCTCASDKSWECKALEQHLQWRNRSEV